MSTLTEAVEAGAEAAYGEGWEELGAFEQSIVRGAVLTVINAALPYIREGIALQLDHRAQLQAGCKHVAAHKQLTYAAADVRKWV
jgi:hypothetical protein